MIKQLSVSGFSWREEMETEEKPVTERCQRARSPQARGGGWLGEHLASCSQGWAPAHSPATSNRDHDWHFMKLCLTWTHENSQGKAAEPGGSFPKRCCCCHTQGMRPVLCPMETRLQEGAEGTVLEGWPDLWLVLALLLSCPAQPDLVREDTRTCSLVLSR